MERGNGNGYAFVLALLALSAFLLPLLVEFAYGVRMYSFSGWIGSLLLLLTVSTAALHVFRTARKATESGDESLPAQGATDGELAAGVPDLH